ARVYVVHTSCEPALRAAVEARARGVDMTVEVVAPHLALDRSYAEQKGFEGAKYVMSPPLREAGNIDAMWRGIRAGHVATIGTDHAPFDFKGQKEMGREDFTKIPNGIPSVQERVVLAHELGVRRGRIDLQTMVAACSTNAARMFGLYPRKGTIREGADGDLVVFDPERRVTLSKSWSASKVDYCAFEGWEVAGTPTHVAVRGALQVRDGEFVGEIGRGRFLRRETSRR
ncbi:MAG: amidohydrolase family protein, partial [Planctomycetota bacterium]|nr:amidohydrolase family protein [Planctomycetota bacterium]